MRQALLLVMLVLPAAYRHTLAQEPDDNPRRRWEDFHQRRAFPFQRIPAGALEMARGQAAALRARGPFGAPPPISGTQWQPIGPTAIPPGGPATGRASAIAVHPTNANIIYVGGAQGGIWKTVDGGATWTPLTDGQCSLAMGSIALDPVNPNIVYAGTGEQHFSGDSYYGCGVLRSTDGGTTWTRLGAGVFSPGSGGARISRIVIAPRTAGNPATTTVFAASDLGLFRSTNGGGTWSEVLAGSIGCSASNACMTTDLAIHPTNDSILYASIFFRGVFRSNDRGTTWTPPGTGFPAASVGRINIALAPSAPDTVYASVHSTANNQLLGIWRTSNGGAAWAQIGATGASCSTQCWYDMHLAVHPTNPATIYFGGVNLFQSLDGGATFSVIGASIHVDQHLLVFDPQNPQTVYAANDGGIYRSANGGAAWTSLNNGLALTQFYPGISLHPTDQTIVLGGTQDNGTLQYSGLPRWDWVLGGDGGFTAIDRDNPTVRYAETQWAANSGYSGPRRSTGGSYALKVSGIGTSDRALFIPPLVMDPTTPTTLYFGTFVVYRTTNRGDLWTLFSADITGGGGAVSAIAPAPSDPRVVYAGASTGLVHVTTDGGINWNLRTAGLPTRFIEDFAVDRADAQTAYVVVSGFGSGHVFRTANAGQTWVDRSGNLPNVPVNAVLTDPASRGIVIIGTDLGVFVTSDSGATWVALDQGMPNVAVFDLAYNPATATLIAATHGRGMFQLQLNRPLTVAVVPGSRRDTVQVGATTARPDSATVVLTGTGAASAVWNATHRAAATWLALGVSAGAGGSRVTWTRNPAGLAAGVFVDTISVTSPGAADSPWRFLDSLVVLGPGAVFNRASTSDTALSGAPGTRPGSAQLSLRGGVDLTTAWSARHGVAAPWLSFVTASGAGSGTVSWTRSSADLVDGTYRDTILVITVTADTARIEDVFVVQAPAVATACAARHVLGTACLGATELRWLDLAGNRDNHYNLGDLVAFIARGGGALPTAPQPRSRP